MGGSWSYLSYRLKLWIEAMFGLWIPASSTPLSNYHPTVPESTTGQNSSRTIEEQIEHSKIHWSQLVDSKLDADEVVEVSNVEVFQALQLHPQWGNFFYMFSEDGIGKIVLGQKFAEGGQAELYDAKIHWNVPEANELKEWALKKWALKVFKKGTSLRLLQSQWPYGMFKDYADRMELIAHGKPLQSRNINNVWFGTLLEDGRFAFVMDKEHEDLRQQIDRLMLTTSKNCCPYLKSDGELTMYQVALGMDWLHTHGIVHRDVKASNVLYTKLDNYSWVCAVADFECSNGVIGTGFFRAPEILQACKDYSINDKPELFTKESDVYSYGMLCYEVLTGRLPFDDYRRNDYGHVLAGERPKVPEYVDGWMQELLRMCWQSNPANRPSFGVILEIFVANSKICRIADARIKEVEAERAMVNSENGHVD